MSEQAEAKSPTAVEESEPKANSSPAPEGSGAEGAEDPPGPTEAQASETQAAKTQVGEAQTAAPTADAEPSAAPTAAAPVESLEPAAPVGVEAAAPTAAPEAVPEAAAAAEQTQPAEAQPAETPTVEAQPAQAAESQPAESQPADSEPAVAQAEEPRVEDPAVEAPAMEVPAPEAPAIAAAAVEAPAVDAPAVDAPAAEAPAGEVSPAEAAAAPATEAPPVAREPKPLTEEELARLAEIESLREARDEHLPVSGRVIGWNQGGFHVVIGTLTAFCPRSEMELKNPKSPSVYLDQELQFHVIKHQKKGKRIVVSRKQFLEEERARVLESMKESLVAGADLTGKISSITDFGAFVDLGGGVEGLVHITELSNRRVKHPKDVVALGQETRVKVLKVEQDGQRISLSMKAFEPNPYAEFAKDHPRGAQFQGKVVRKTDFGIFVELLPGLDGMIHLSHLPPGVTLEDDRLSVGNEVQGWVIRVEPKRERISLSLKEVPSEDPWKGVLERYAEGAVVEGQVEDVAPFGVFIQLEPGLTGLLPNSEMSLPRGQDRSKHYPPGKKVGIQIASIDPQRKRISLVPEGSHVEGSRSDYRDYLKEQKKQGEGMTAMAAAFAKLREQGQDQA